MLCPMFAKKYTSKNGLFRANFFANLSNINHFLRTLTKAVLHLKQSKNDVFFANFFANQ
jgi:Tfp pilus assembly pilus retraction ATPase PilT